MVALDGSEFPEKLFYDLDNQIWYEPLADDTVRAGFTLWASKLMGDVLVFTPKRIGKDFERDKSFAVVEGGKWVGAARAAFEGVVVAHNDMLMRKPELLNSDPFGEGWMLIVRPARDDWKAGLLTDRAIKPAFEAWLANEAYKNRAG
jgi:glycine cleavage system H protein